jgi:hypothetical protein
LCLALDKLGERVKYGYYQLLTFKIGGYSFEKEITQPKDWAS